MKCITILFDTLNRRHLPPYGASDVIAPNFARLAQRSLTFDRSYVCSMPCIPARRELHTGRPNFLHCNWGPLEPFDDSMPRMLRDAGIHSALITDHQHYFEEGGGGTYHNKFSSWQFNRGQEGDPCWGQVRPVPPENAVGVNAALGFYPSQDRINRQFLRQEEDQPQARTFAGGLDFIERNAKDDRWFLQIETFDPHEPFFTQKHYQDLYREEIGSRDETPLFDWPGYRPWPDDYPPHLEKQLRAHYKALVTMCDTYLGKVLDAMDRHELWEDTMLIVCTDHGFLLGEHRLLGKSQTPYYNEIAHTPFFVWDPRSAKAGERRMALVQPALDIVPTVLDFFGLEPTPDMTSKNLRDVIANDVPVREFAIFGGHGNYLNITDGRYVLMQAPDPAAGPVYNYTLMPLEKHAHNSIETLRQAELHPPFAFTKGLRTLKIPSEEHFRGNNYHRMNFEGRSALFDLHTDPEQKEPIENADVTDRLLAGASAIAREVDAPAEIYPRYHLPL